MYTTLQKMETLQRKYGVRRESISLAEKMEERPDEVEQLHV